MEKLSERPIQREVLEFLSNLLKESQQIDDVERQIGLTRAMKEIVALRQSVSYFRLIGDNLYDGIYVTDGDGKTLYINKAYTRITGISPDEVVGKHVDDLMAKGLFKNAVTPLVIQQKKPVNSVGEISQNGRKLLISGVPVFDEEGRVSNVVVIDRDITDLATIQAELEASQQKIQAVEKDQKKHVQEIQLLRNQQLRKNLIGNSPEMTALLKEIEQAAQVDVTVLITGETGVGKEVVSTELHLSSQRSDGPFIKVNCAAIPTNLLEAELFGYEKGAFTGAGATAKMGLFELADKGTILLDEIGELPIELQAKLLRVIQQKELMRLGGTKPVKLDVRLLAATNCDLQELIRQGRFRSDLYYRLNVLPIQILPLRRRKGDIQALCAHFLGRYNSKYGKEIKISETGMVLLREYPWPGNVRELKNIIERLVIISEAEAVLGLEQIGSLLNIDVRAAEVLPVDAGLKKIVEDVERRTIEKVLATCGSTRSAAKVLQVDQSTIVKKAKKLGISLRDDKMHLS